MSTMDIEHGPTRTKIVKRALAEAGVESFKVESWQMITFVHPAVKWGDLTDTLRVLRSLNYPDHTAWVDHTGAFAVFGPEWAMPC